MVSPKKRIAVSVVMPCLDEVASVEKCIKEASGKDTEVLVVDNGSTDGSREVVKSAIRKNGGRVRLVEENDKGYGATLLRGFRAARGGVVVMGDSDGSYDFREIPKLTKPIFTGKADLVVGSRIKGNIERGAMPWLHQRVGTPFLTQLANSLFDLKLSDSQSGMRAISRTAYQQLGMRMKGMEFASEMLVRASRAKLRVVEVPINYRKRIGESKLMPLRDAWRHIRFLLLFSPGRLFTIPGVVLFFVGSVLFGLTAPGPLAVGTGVLDVHTLSIAGMTMILGFQVLSLGMYARVYGKYSFGIEESDIFDYFIERFELEQGLRIGGLLVLLGITILGWLGSVWVLSGFSALSQIRPVMVGTVLTMLGMQMVFGSFFLSFLRGEGK